MRKKNLCKGLPAAGVRRIGRIDANDLVIRSCFSCLSRIIIPASPPPPRSRPPKRTPVRERAAECVCVYVCARTSRTCIYKGYAPLKVVLKLFKIGIECRRYRKGYFADIT